MDRRLIQTAVFGSPDSDEPALCPEEAEELDVFRREHAGESIWCGTSLPGGCGRQLMTRRCIDKVSHFAHYKDNGAEHQCGRRTRGKDGANHLFVKADLAAWARTQGVPAVFDYPEPLGSAVMIRLEDARVVLVHLDKARPVSWRDETVWEIVLGPGVRSNPGALARRGYVHRIRFEDEPGGRRRVQFGTEKPRLGTDWFSLDKLVLTAEGLTEAGQPTPAAPARATAPKAPAPKQRTILPATSPATTKPPGRQPAPIRQALLRLSAAVRENQPRHVAAAVSAIEKLLRAYSGQDAVDLSAALARGKQWQEQRTRLRKTVLTRLEQESQAGGSPTLLAQAVELVQDVDATEEEKTVVRDIQARAQRAAQERRKALIRQQTERREAQERQRAQRAAAARETQERQRAQRAAAAQEARERRQRAAQKDRVEQLQPVAATVRGALKKAAREGRVTTWPDLKKRTGHHQLGRLNHRDKIEVLLLVESVTQPEEPLWSVLLTAEGDSAALQLYRDVSHRLGRPLPVAEAELNSQLSAEREALHRRYL